MTSPSPAIADTSALSALCRIGRLEILRWRFLSVIVPHAVLMELEAADDRDLTSMIDQACEAGWMRVADPSISGWQAPVSRLGPGETAALALAVAMPEAVLLMDERRGRRAARMLGLTTTGVLGLLMWAKQAGHLDSLSQAIHALRTHDSFFIDPELLRQALAAVGEELEGPL
jgi:predicted nucleic acid-binding protein